ncbi:G-patch domain-containing protein like [Verticillium longisporum]|uniref:G-patch domain-containing protein like n=3 Tax=Verticillium longisporum TaxID=100787 RepID=A0A8I2ZYN7_VERLO|nr:G-patch domain-containing protein like [Verticillium longisporum]
MSRNIRRGGICCLPPRPRVSTCHACTRQLHVEDDGMESATMSAFPTFDPSRLTKKSAAAQYSSDSDEDNDDEFTTPIVDPAAGDDFHNSNPRKRRRVGESKDRAALGIFASDSEDDGPGKRWKKKTLRGKGMSFVSTGTMANAQDEKEYSDDSDRNGPPAAEEDDEEADEEEDEEEEEAAGVGLGFRSTTYGGLGFAPATKDEDTEMQGQDEAPYKPSFVKTKFDGRNPLGRGFVPSSARQPVLTNFEDDEKPKKPTIARPSAFAPSRDGTGSTSKPNPKSFGARMMAKMGYVEGTGLGKESQGRNVIIEANLRPQGVGLGAVKEKSVSERREEKRQAELRGEVVIDSDEEEKKKRRERKKRLGASGISSGTSTPRRQKTAFMTAEEIKRAAPGLHIPDAFAPILDMTGPGNKLLTSISGLLTPTSATAPESAEAIEARKIVRRAHADLAAFSEEWRSLEERKSWVELELRQHEQETADLAADLERMRVFAGIVTNELPAATEWQDKIRCLQKAIDAVGSPNSEVTDIAVSAIHPFFRDPDWVLLEEPKRFATELNDMRGLLTKSATNEKTIDKLNATANGLNDTDLYRQHHKATTPYETMMYKLWYPKARGGIRNWDVYDPAPLLAVLEAWNSLLPAFVRAQFLQDVVRKLETAVSEWNPRKKRQSYKLPHLWLFPWLQYLPSYHLDPKGTGLVADVRRKFRQLVDVWEFDRGVVPGLTQWRDVLGSQWQPLIMSHVLPSMGRYLRENFRVDPGDQEPYLPMLTGTLRWSSVLGSKVLAEVIVAEVFPLWHDKLGEWLQLEEVNLEEVYAWYEWWRDQVFPKELATLPVITKEFDKGSLTIERALERM